MTAAELAGVTVLVTRPAGQNDELVHRLAAAGADPIVFPLIAIYPPPDRARLEAVLAGLGQYELAIFASRNAVHYGLAAVRHQHGDWPPALPVAAIGAGTAAALAGEGVPVTVHSPPPYDSERLLGCPRLRAVRDQRIVIFRGQDGRALLAAELGRRGARVEYAACYQRAMPSGDPEALRARLAARRVDIIFLTSTAALHNLRTIAGDAASTLLNGVTPVVFGPRVAAAWRDWGVGCAPRMAREASDAALVDAVSEWRRVDPGEVD